MERSGIYAFQQVVWLLLYYFHFVHFCYLYNFRYTQRTLNFSFSKPQRDKIHQYKDVVRLLSSAHPIALSCRAGNKQCPNLIKLSLLNLCFKNL